MGMIAFIHSNFSIKYLSAIVGVSTISVVIEIHAIIVSGVEFITHGRISVVVGARRHSSAAAPTRKATRITAVHEHPTISTPTT